MIKLIILYSCGIFQLCSEFSLFTLLHLTMAFKPFFVFHLLLNIKDLKINSLLAKQFVLFILTMIFCCSLAYLISYILLVYHLLMSDNLFQIIYVYLYTIDVYIYNPLGIPSNPLNLPWGRFTK
jgi:hypothetical protein